MAYGDQAKQNLFSGPVSADNGPTTFGEMDAKSITENSHDAIITDADREAAETIVNRAITEGWSAEQLRNSGINSAYLNQGLDRHKQAMEASGSNPEMTKAQNDDVKAKEMAQLQQGIMGGAAVFGGFAGLAGGLLGGDEQKSSQEKQQDLAALQGIGGAMTFTSMGTMGGMGAVPAIAKEFGSLSHHAKGGEQAHEEDLFVSIRPGQTPAPAMAMAQAQKDARNDQFSRSSAAPR